MTAKNKMVYSFILGYHDTPSPSGEPHIERPGADLWTPSGDITVIGAQLRSGMNHLPATSQDNSGSYVYADVSLIAKRDEANAIINTVYAEVKDVAADQIISGMRQTVNQVMFPEGYGQDTDRWHPVYLNCGFRTFFTAGGIEVYASALVWFVER